MPRRVLDSGDYGQLRWVILLLAVAVILPTVCLLWFMSQAVKNVQLAARQKLMDVYEDSLSNASRETNETWAEELEHLDQLIDQNSLSITSSELFDASYHAVIVYDEQGNRFYPLVSTDVNVPLEATDQFSDAWELEFTQKTFSKAARLYQEKADSNDSYACFSALIGWSRCLAKLGDTQQAIEVCKKVAVSPETETCDTATLMLIANARLLLVQLLRPAVEEDDSSFKDRQSLQNALAMLREVVSCRNAAGSVLPLDQSVFLAHRAHDVSEAAENTYGLEDSMMDGPMMSGSPTSFEQRMLEHSSKWQTIVSIRDDGALTLAMIDRFPTTAELQDWTAGRFRQLQLDEQSVCYGLWHTVGDKTVLLLQSDYIWGFHHYESVFQRSGLTYCIRDNLGRVVYGGGQHRGDPILTLSVGGYFADWQVELYFENDDILEGAARKQITLYTWAGVLVIVLILAAGGFAGQAVTRQIKLNRLKNDFIATVSHELKTPLASMRVLADTLLEGNYKDQQQATEYLQLICKENKRLSGLIDDFLTFSRMERNKQAFEMAEISPADVAQAAVEAVATKFNGGRCEVQMQVDENLPDVFADRDAMVTVLVNLLDNAYKYSGDDREIALRVFAADGVVCFSVSDNGMGMSRRAARKIFERFYQVDHSLTRRTEGCGLGLSIVKFIVDAHKGSITVDSAPGQGSTFLVKLPSTGLR